MSTVHPQEAVGYSPSRDNVSVFHGEERVNWDLSGCRVIYVITLAGLLPGDSSGPLVDLWRIEYRTHPIMISSFPSVPAAQPPRGCAPGASVRYSSCNASQSSRIKTTFPRSLCYSARLPGSRES